ncbi:MAG: hypothetical protein A2Z65_07735 [Gallionellales bacterium RIFCSPLOWO2_02_58_13]|nr:MAG: hypothetical protein A2Z65_07735 [Gallionellales bacterium RIFCSPLOWO2_02_58_13]
MLVQASCNPAATSYTWVNTGFASTVSSGYLDTPITTTTYYVTGHNASGSSDQASATHEVLAVVPTCTLTAAPPLIAPNGESILTASCNPAATSYTWTGGTCAVITTNSCTVTLAAGSQNYTVAGSNATGHGNTAGASVTVAPPTCTLTAAPPLIAPDGTSVLTASCSPAATDGYTWTGTGCVGELTNTCTVTLATASESYTVAGINGAGTGAPSPAATVTVSKPSCTLTAAPPSVAPGESSTLTASCTATPTSYAWDGSCAGSTTSCTVTPGATATYRMTATNLEGTSNPAEATVAVVVPGICTLDHRNIPFNWETDRGRNINEPLSRGQSLSFEFTTPGANAAGPLVKEQGNSSVGVPAWTFINISASQCDFTYPTLDISWNGCGQHGNVVALKYKVENVDSHTFGYCSLRPNTTYYINIRNEDIYAPGVDTCEAGATCGFLFNMTGSLTD